MQELQQLYEELKRKEGQGKAPLLLHRPATFLDRVFQENPIETIEKVVVDTRSIVKRIRRQSWKRKSIFYNEKSSMFNHFGIEREIEKALQKLCGFQMVLI